MTRFVDRRQAALDFAAYTAVPGLSEIDRQFCAEQCVNLGAAPREVRYHGVDHHPLGNRAAPYRASIYYLGRQHHLGYYATADEAARVHDREAWARGKRLTSFNFPQDYLQRGDNE
jgi:hypothetical protein